MYFSLLYELFIKFDVNINEFGERSLLVTRQISNAVDMKGKYTKHSHDTLCFEKAKFQTNDEF